MIEFNKDKESFISSSLILLFPIFAVTTKHWASTFFFLMAIAGLVHMAIARDFFKSFIKGGVFFAFPVLFFISYLITSFSIGWDDEAWSAMGTEIRYPLILLLGTYIFTRRNALKTYCHGAALGVAVSLVYVVYAVFYVGTIRDELGAYGPLFLGPVTLIFSAFVVFGAELGLFGKKYSVAISVLIFISVLFVALLTSRSTLSALFVVTILYGLYKFKASIFKAIFISIVLSTFSIFLQLHDDSRERFKDVFVEVEEYFALGELTEDEKLASSVPASAVGSRLEMFKATGFVLESNPWLGVGRYHYEGYVKQRIDEGKLHPSALFHGHPHNMFTTTIFFKGLLGLLVVMFWFLYLYKKFRHEIRHGSRELGYLGIVVLASILVTQATESAVFIKGNFIAVFLISITVVMSSIIRSK
jgi:O-antigen ligase